MISDPEIVEKLEEARNILVQYEKVSELRLKLIEACNGVDFPLQNTLEDLLERLQSYCSEKIIDNLVIFDIRARDLKEEEEEENPHSFWGSNDEENLDQQWRQKMREEEEK
mgnify:CR=1 FL=1|tara:strand:- start:400 stop:732 length:333 start_codon:yes stop_codon:yes gene_type:complete